MGKSDLWHARIDNDYGYHYRAIVESQKYRSLGQLYAEAGTDEADNRFVCVDGSELYFSESGPVYSHYLGAIRWAERRLTELNEKSKGPKSMDKKLYMFDDADDTRVFGSISDLMAELGMNETKSCVEVTITRKFTLRNQTVEVED